MLIHHVNHTTIKEQGAYLSTEAVRTEKVGDVSSFCAFDDEKEIKEAHTIDAVAAKAKSLTDSKTDNHAEYVAGMMNPEIMGKATEEGVDIEKEEEDVSLTVVDKIQMEMIEAGDEAVMKTADFSSKELSEVSGEVAAAYEMARKLSSPTEKEIAYLVKNDLEPTIGNIYQAKAATSTVEVAKNTISSPSAEEEEGLQHAIEDKLRDFDVQINEENITRATAMVKGGIALTEENYKYYQQLEELKLPLPDGEIEESIYESVRFGRTPASGMMVDGYSWPQRAMNAVDVVENAAAEDIDYLVGEGLEININNLAKAHARDAKQVSLSDEQKIKAVTARRVLEQTRLVMTAQANLSLMKKGIHIETEKLEKLVEELEQQENAIKQSFYHRTDEISAETAKEIHKNTTEALTELKMAPAYVLYEIKTEYTLAQAEDIVRGIGADTKASYEKANGAYETMQTEVRRDLGDSIQKAFRNVDDILEDLDLETSETNQRAVRMLAYNRVELTVENIAAMKEKDVQMQNLFKNMTPRVVLSMIREGYNPLDATLTELNQKAKEIQESMDPGKAEKYSKFLYQLEKAGNITPEEKETYIGIYRLLYQVEKSDGAAVGAAVLAGEKLTMRNLMTQVRNHRAGKVELVSDEKAGEKISVKTADLSITQQIESAYQTACAENSLKDFTPAALKKMEEGISSEGKDLLDLTPEELMLRQNEIMQQEISEEEKQIAKEEHLEAQQRIQTSYTILHSNAQVEEFLTKNEISKTPENILAVADLIKNRNKVYKDLYEASQKSDLIGELEEAKEEVWNRFAESVKTPEEMAKAQEALGDLAESVMENMIVEQEATALDIKSMQMCARQISLLGEAAKREEYAVPVLVQDEMGVVRLKIVRGKEEKGKVSITMETEGFGKLAAEFSVENFRLKGYVVAENDELAQHMEDIKKQIEEEMENYVSDAECVVVSNPTLSLDNFHKGASVDGSMNNEVQTQTLYGIARSFIGILQSLS